MKRLRRATLWLSTLFLLQTTAWAANFPLQVSRDGTHLTDSVGSPFLVVGDSAWSLIGQLFPDEAGAYFEDRKKRGFTSILINLLEHKFASKAPANNAGVAPFLTPASFSEPNPAYFNAARHAVIAARDRGLAVWLCPAYLGWDGGAEGFAREIRKAGPQRLRDYGKWVAAVFKDMPNIVWVVGGDYDVPPAEQWMVSELTLGLREGGARQLITAQGGQKSATETFGTPEWLALDTVYSYRDDLWKELQKTARREPVRPFVMIKSAYEGERSATPGRIRAQAWWSMLCGAAGQFFGNNPIWYFDGPGFTRFRSAPNWKAALELQGSQDMERLAKFFATVRWQDLRPDLRSAILGDGTGDGARRIVASRSTGNRWGLVYVPDDGLSRREFQLNLGSFVGPLQAEWVNPARSTANKSLGAPLQNRDGHKIVTPGDNGTGANDWLLLLKGQSPP